MLGKFIPMNLLENRGFGECLVKEIKWNDRCLTTYDVKV